MGKDTGKSDGVYDVAIVGAGPAGATAAISLVQQGRRVLLLDRDDFPRVTTSASWLNARAEPLLVAMKVPIKALLHQAFRDVTFYNGDFSNSAKPNFEQVPGYLIDRAKFGHALVKKAKAEGTSVVTGLPVSTIRPLETSVVTSLSDGRDFESRLIVLAHGRGGHLAERLGFTRSRTETPSWSAQVDAPIKRTKASHAPRVGVVLGMDGRGSFGMFCLAETYVSISLNWHGDPTLARPSLVQFCKTAFAQDLLPVDLSTQAGVVEFVPCPTSTALDMDSHVGKHSLLIGDAGGFVAAVSHEGLYPAMWSAVMAAEVVHAALDSVHSQDELMKFDSQWRMAMADYLRSPNTDSQFLIPLVFSNQPMADRMGAAFFSGDNI